MATAAFVVTTALSAQQAAQAPPQGQTAQPNPQAPQPVFRSRREVITVDAIVRDKSGAIARGLTAADFEIREDGRPQDVLNFSFEEIRDKCAGEDRDGGSAGWRRGQASGADTLVRFCGGPAPRPPPPLTSESMAGRRLITLLFDVSSMQPDDVQRAVDSAQKYVSEKMSAADLVAVVTVSSTLSVLTDFTADRGKVAAALTTLGYAEGTATPPPDASTAATDEAAAAATDDAATETSDLDLFNNDIRLRALKTLADTLAPIEQKKSIIYFSAGMQRSGQDNQVELRAAINAAVRGNVAFYPIDTRGLQAVVPGGDARQASGRGNSMFSGRGVAQQYDTLAGVAGYADVARRRHRRPGIHRHQRLRRGVRARAERHVGLLPAGLQQHQPGARRPISPHPGPRRSATASRSRLAAATTPTAISSTRAAAIARRSCRISSSPRCRRPTCR